MYIYSKFQLHIHVYERVFARLVKCLHPEVKQMTEESKSGGTLLFLCTSPAALVLTDPAAGSELGSQIPS